MKRKASNQNTEENQQIKQRSKEGTENKNNQKTKTINKMPISTYPSSF